MHPLLEALKPFTKMADVLEKHSSNMAIITIGDIRRAQATFKKYNTTSLKVTVEELEKTLPEKEGTTGDDLQWERDRAVKERTEALLDNSRIRAERDAAVKEVLLKEKNKRTGLNMFSSELLDLRERNAALVSQVDDLQKECNEARFDAKYRVKMKQERNEARCEAKSQVKMKQEAVQQKDVLAARLLKASEDMVIELEEKLNLSKMSVEEKCRKLHIQNCHICPVLSCCDNTSPARADWDEMERKLNVADVENTRLRKELSARKEEETVDVARVRLKTKERNAALRDNGVLHRALSKRDAETKKLRTEIAELRAKFGMTECREECKDCSARAESFESHTIKLLSFALRKAYLGEQNAETARDRTIIELIELKDGFLKILEPFVGLLQKGMANDAVLYTLGDVEVTVGDIRKAQALCNKGYENEEEVNC